MAVCATADSHPHVINLEKAWCWERKEGRNESILQRLVNIFLLKSVGLKKKKKNYICKVWNWLVCQLKNFHHPKCFLFGYTKTCISKHFTIGIFKYSSWKIRILKLCIILLRLKTIKRKIRYLTVAKINFVGRTLQWKRRIVKIKLFFFFKLMKNNKPSGPYQLRINKIESFFDYSLLLGI